MQCDQCKRFEELDIDFFTIDRRVAPVGWIRLLGKWDGQLGHAPEFKVDLCTWTCVERYAQSKFDSKLACISGSCGVLHD
jgi:hypothetical protein